MRIGDLDYLDKTKTSGIPEAAQGTVNADTPELTEKQQKLKKWKNWWYYYKWYVICGIILLGILLNLAGSYLGWWAKSPDVQIAYIGKSELPAETASALEQAFASLISDFNGDGEIIVRVNQYTDGLQSDDPDTSYYEYASEISLIGDISDCESYFFLTEDPRQFQLDYQLLASPDGSCPDDTDYTVEDKVIPWNACTLLSGMELGTYTVRLPGSEITGTGQELLSGFFMGRRCFFTDKTTEHADKCAELWELLYNSCQ